MLCPPPLPSTVYREGRGGCRPNSEVSSPTGRLSAVPDEPLRNLATASRWRLRAADDSGENASPSSLTRGEVGWGSSGWSCWSPQTDTPRSPPRVRLGHLSHEERRIHQELFGAFAFAFVFGAVFALLFGTSSRTGVSSASLGLARTFSLSAMSGAR